MEQAVSGRPSLYSAELAERICARLAEGESLLAICRDEAMPHRATVHEWVFKNIEGFGDKYACAREVGCDAMADALMEIADDGKNDFVERKGGEDEPGGLAFNAEHVQRSKLRVDARKWYLSKKQVEHSGSLTLEKALAQSFDVKEADGGGS
jgi:hypothetical protein